jgi:Flp pilus assembly protein TadG
MFGLAVPMLALAVGGGIDISRAAAQRQRMASTVELSCQHSSIEVSYRRAQAGANAKQDYTSVVNDITNKKMTEDGQTGVAVASTIVDDAITIRASGASANAFAGIIGYSSVALQVERSCTIVHTPVPAPGQITFKLDYAYGWYWKRVTLWVHKPGDSADTQIASMVYQPTDKSGANGRGTGSVTGSLNQTLDLGVYDKIYLKMEVSTNGCPPGQAPNSGGQCKRGESGSIYTIRTDDPNTSNHLFVNGKQLPANSSASVLQLFKCGQSVSHAWEDGGGWSKQDIGFTVTATNCTQNDKVT